MALTADETTLLFEIFEIPQNGVMSNFLMVSSPFGAAGDDQDASAAMAHLTARITALSANQITRAQTLLARWLAIAQSPAVIRDKNGSVVADHPKERNAIRFQLSKLIGINTPKNSNNSADKPFSISR